MAKHKTVFGKMFGWVGDLFDKLPKTEKGAIHIGVGIVENIKNVVDTKAVDLLTLIVPGELDDKIKDILRKRLPAILTGLKLAKSCEGNEDINILIECAIDAIQKVEDKEISGAIKRDIWGLDCSNCAW